MGIGDDRVSKPRELRCYSLSELNRMYLELLYKVSLSEEQLLLLWDLRAELDERKLLRERRA